MLILLYYLLIFYFEYLLMLSTETVESLREAMIIIVSDNTIILK
jgi:hypothetical protein